MMKNIIAAFQFLTILPMPVNTTQKNLEKSILWYPLVGAAIGLITGYGYRLLGLLFPVGISSALTLLVYIILTRGLHLDGFMDTIDGFLSHRGGKDGAVILRIMKEPTVGSFAVLGAIMWALVLSSALPYLGPLDYVLVHMLARLAILPVPLLFSYPRESGTGKFFAENVKPGTVFAAVFMSLVIMAAVFFLRGESSVTLALVWVVLAVLSFLIALVIGKWSKKRINGVTGDVLGFTIEALHVVLVLAFSLVIIHGVTT